MMHRGFTLIEMLVATILSGILMAGVLVMTTSIGRDRARVAADEALPRSTGLVDQLRWDLTNATTMSQADSGHLLVLTGHGALDAQTLAPTGRLARVIYEVRGKGRDATLFRTQAFLDDPVRPEPWTELVAFNVSSVVLIPESADAYPVEKEKPISLLPPEEELIPRRRRAPQIFYVPSRARLSVQRMSVLVEEEFWLR